MHEGNDRVTEHYARLVVAINREEAQNPYTMAWGEDLEETLIRYGRTVGWSRVQSMPSGIGGVGGGIQDTRSTVGHHHPKSRGLPLSRRVPGGSRRYRSRELDYRAPRGKNLVRGPVRSGL